MAISIQSTPQPQTTYNVHQGRGIGSRIKQDVQALSTALQSGDLQSAQKSYGDLQKLLQSNGSISQASTSTTPSTTAAASSTTPTPTGPLDAVKSDFQALGQALQSGDLAGAQKDYAQLAKDSQQIVAQQGAGTGRTGGHHHHHAQPAAGADSDGDSDGSGSSSSSSPSTTTTSPSPATSSATASAYQFNLSASFTGASSSGADPNAPSPFSQIKNDFQTIGKDLQAGNFSNLQTDFTQLNNDVQQLGGTQNGSSTSKPSAGLSAYQFSIAASLDSATVDSSGNAAVSHDAVSLQQSYQSADTSTQPQPNQASSFQLNYQSSHQSVSFVA